MIKRREDRNRSENQNTKRVYFRRKKLKERFVKQLGGKCERCGYNENPMILEFHHKNPEEKEFEIGQAISRGVPTSRPELIQEEVLKCELVCPNCHRNETTDYFSSSELPFE